MIITSLDGVDGYGVPPPTICQLLVVCEGMADAGFEQFATDTDLAFGRPQRAFRARRRKSASTLPYAYSRICMRAQLIEKLWLRVEVAGCLLLNI